MGAHVRAEKYFDAGPAWIDMSYARMTVRVRAVVVGPPTVCFCGGRGFRAAGRATLVHAAGCGREIPLLEKGEVTWTQS
jgi:hypothetical protein